MIQFDILQNFLRMERAAGSAIEGFVMPDGINIWPHLRMAMYNAFAWDDYKQKNLCAWPGIYTQKYALPPSFYKALTRVPRQSCVFFSRPTLHIEKVRGKRYDPYLDPVIQEAHRSGIFPVKMVISDGVPKDNLEDALIPPLHFVRLTSNTVFTLHQHLPSIPGYDAYVDVALQHHVPVLHPMNILQAWHDVSAHAALFEQILSFMQPRMVVIECYYTFELMGLAQACRKLGIPCVEYQHGLQTGVHVPYCFEYIPKQGYAVVPEWFFHWGEASAKAMQKRFAGQNYHKALVAGKPSYVAWKRGILQEDPDTLSRFVQRVQGRIPICVALPLEGDSGALLEAAMAQAPAEWLWLLRQHPLCPQALASDLAALYPDATEVDDCSALRLFTVLENTQHMVTWLSSSALEAVSLFNMEVTCLGEDSKKYFSHNMHDGSIHCSTTPEEVLLSIYKGLSRYPHITQSGCELTSDIKLLSTALQSVYRTNSNETAQ